MTGNTVVDPKTEAKEVFGVHSPQLVAHSSVFRTMMSDPKWVNSKSVDISDITAEVFKLVLTYAYGGMLPKISRSAAVELAFAADKYFMPRLVNEAGKQLIPTTLEEFYPALHIMGFFPCPDLEPHLLKFIEADTETIMKSEEILDLPGESWGFILKQDVFNVEEVVVWRHLIKWAEHQVTKNPEKTLRGVLLEPLKYLRLATMSHEHIIKEVLPTKVLTSDEMLSLLSAVAWEQVWDLPGFCNNVVPRKLPEVHVFKALKSFSENEYFGNSKTSSERSSLIIKPLKNLELLCCMVCNKASVTEGTANNENSLSCSATLERFAADNALRTVPLTQSDGSFLRLKANQTYKLKISFPTSKKLYKLYIGTGSERHLSTFETRAVKDVMTVTFTSSIHVREIHYRILP